MTLTQDRGAVRPEPVVLEGHYVRLEPLTLEHVPALMEVATDPELWRWTIAEVRTEADLKRYVQEALDAQAQGQAVPFATVARTAGHAIGSTRFGSIDLRHARVEIGWTWIGRPWQRTAINTEAKLLMLRHAFEAWGCLRVELRTDVLNQRSRAAIRRIGATEEGVFRKHMITESGRQRDTVYYSILAEEWPGVKARLTEMLAAH
jgi:RimJ/RimL family protein N-acetyltransferase